MKDSGKRNQAVRARSKSAAKQHFVIHGMVGELLNQIHPGGYRGLLNDLRAEYQPSGTHEEFLVERLAHAAWRLQGCPALEAKILRKGMQTCPGGENNPEALLHAYRQDFEGLDLLSKLSNYETRLRKEFYRCLHELERCGASRRAAASRAAAAKLAKLPPCTSVVQ